MYNINVGTHLIALFKSFFSKLTRIISFSLHKLSEYSHNLISFYLQSSTLELLSKHFLEPAFEVKSLCH